MSNLLDYVGLGYFLEKIKTLFVTALGTSGNSLTWTKNGTTNNITIPYATEASKLSIILTKTYTDILRNNVSYASPYTNSYLYFGSVKTTNLALPSHVKYRVLAYAPSNASFLLESIVEWYFGNNGMYKGYYVWNNLSSTSYYPFYCHTLYSAKTAAIATSDGSYLGCYYGTSTSYGQSPSTVARTIKIEILECNNCTVDLLNDVVWLVNVDNVPANLKLPSTSKAYNDTNFTANNVVTSVGLQETGDANTNTVGYLIRTNSYSKPMKAALGYGYRLLFTSADLLGWIPVNTSTSSNATATRTPCTEPIDPFGEIVYYAGTAAVAVGARPGATSLWLQYTITLGYSFNTTGAALTLTSWKPVYIKCTPLANGSATLEGYTQDLPTGEDGFIYIYLGVAYSATAVELVIKHPVYYYKNGAIRLWTGELEEKPHDYSCDYLTFEALEDGTFNFSLFNNNEIYYSKNGGTWTLGNSVDVVAGDKVRWKGEMTPLEQDHSGGIGTFGSGEDADSAVTTISYKAYGNTMSLLYGDNFIGKTELVGTWTFNCLFRKTKITESHNLILPATTLTSHCYWKMFFQCAEMISMPNLHATTLAHTCYGMMFMECSVLTDNIPSELSATTLTESCYINMFNKCTSLVVAPKLPATTLTNNCYTAMFQGCSNLEVAPELPAPTLTSNCYWHMFDGCSKLNYIKCLATNKSVGGCCAVWMNNVAASGIFIKADGTTWGVGGSGTGPGVPSSWNIYSESEWEVVRHYELVTLSTNGLMSSSDKTKLDGIAAGAQVNVVTSVDTTATAGVNLSLTSGTLDVTVSGGSIASGNGSVVTGGTVYAVTSTLAPKASPALTGTPTAPTAAAGTNTTQIATTAFVKNAVDSKTHYVANLLSGTAANYITEPEFKSVKVNGSSTNSASSSNCVLQYDTTNKCLKFIFN